MYNVGDDEWSMGSRKIAKKRRRELEVNVSRVHMEIVLS